MHRATLTNDQAFPLRKLMADAHGNPPPSQPRIVTVTGGKGGVGRSTVALNLAVALSAIHREVFLYDADLALGKLDFLCGAHARVRLPHVLRGEREIHEAVVTPVKGLAILPGGSDEIVERSEWADEQIAILNEVRENYRTLDFILVDTPAGVSTDVVKLAATADEVLVVTTPEPTAIMDAYAVIKLTFQMRADAHIGVVMNNVRTPVQADDGYRKLQMAVGHFLNLETTYLGFIPSDRSVAEAGEQQTPVVQYSPLSPASNAFRLLAEVLVRRTAKSDCRERDAS